MDNRFEIGSRFLMAVLLFGLAACGALIFVTAIGLTDPARVLGPWDVITPWIGDAGSWGPTTRLITAGGAFLATIVTLLLFLWTVRPESRPVTLHPGG